jgi:GDP-L-fucose synthase
LAPRRRDFDLTKSDDVQRLFNSFQPEIVIHAAAVVGGIQVNRDHPGRFFYQNALMGLQTIEACRQYGVEKTVVLGTVCSYPSHTPAPFREQDLWNGYPEETNAPYGIAKKALLAQCQAYRAEYGMDTIFLMPSNLYGPRDNFDPQTGHVIPGLISKFLNAMDWGLKEVKLWGSGEPTRDFLYVDDAAEAIVLATQRYSSASAVNIGSGREVSIRDVAERIARLVNYRGAVSWDKTQPDGQMQRRVDTTRAEREFGFRVRTDLDEGLRRTLAWRLSNREPAADLESIPGSR